MDMIDVSRWFGSDLMINSDFVVGSNVCQHDIGWIFTIFPLSDATHELTICSKIYPTRNDALAARAECIKKLQGEI